MKILYSNTPLKICSRLIVKGICYTMLLAISSSGYTAPQGGVIIGGSANISSAGSNTTITQSSSKAIINWQGFSVAGSESVRFVQPSSSSITLNRVIGPNGSSILGNISANGRVFLINPNGILFGSGSQVNVGGLVASTLGISDNNFMSGKYIFNGNSSAPIVNSGTISTNGDGGYIALLGANVTNNGLISARLGTVALAAGSAMTLDLAGDNLLNITVDQGIVNALVNNGNLIAADGGQILMTAQGAGTLLNNTVNNAGVLQAQSIENKSGVIILSSGSEAGVTNVSGSLNTSGNNASQTGGSIQILGHTVNLVNAQLDASGNAGGGTVLVGGNFSGTGPQRNSMYTNIDSDSRINVNAIQAGNGGRISVWSDGTTRVAGRLSAQGGVLSGDGGFIETSGKVVLIANSASIDALAPKGKTGLWLLDPFDYEICGTCSGLTGETPAQVEASLATINRTILADHDITVSDAITWSTPQTLKLDAGHDVKINAAITGSTAGAQLILVAGNDVITSSAGALTSSGLANQINITATHNIDATGDITSSAGLTNQVNMTAGNNLKVTTLTSGGDTNIIAGNDLTAGKVVADGTATLIAGHNGIGSGTVILETLSPVSANIVAPNTVLRFNPVTYGGSSTEVASYTAKTTSSTPDIKAWVYLQGNNRTYDQTTAASLSFVGTPSAAGAVSLVDGTANFATKDAATGKTISYSGYSLSTSADLALFYPGTTPGAGTTTATISPAALIVSATGTDKVYNGTTTDVVTLSDNRIAGDVFTASNSSANFATASVGNNKQVNVLGISIAGPDAANYISNTSATTSASITSPSNTPIEPILGATVPGAVVPLVPIGLSNQPPAALQQDVYQSGIYPIPIIAMGAVSGGDPTIKGRAALLTVVAAPPLIGMQSLFPAPYVAPIRIPKQGRN